MPANICPRAFFILQIPPGKHDLGRADSAIPGSRPIKVGVSSVRGMLFVFYSTSLNPTRYYFAGQVQRYSEETTTDKVGLVGRLRLLI